MLNRQVRIDELVKRFLDFQVVKYADDTRAAFTSVLTAFAKDFGSALAEDIKPEDVTAWVVKRGTWKTPTTRNMALARVKKMYAWSLEYEFITANPMRLIRRKDLPWADDEVTGFEPVSDADFEKILEECNERLERILRFIRESGVSPGEARLLKWSDVDLFKNIITIPQKDRHTGEMETRLVPITDKIREILAVENELHREKSDFVFITSRNVPWERQSLNAEFRRAFKKQGFDHVSLYGAGRLAFYDRALGAGLQPAEVAALTGLKSADVINARVMKDLRSNPEKLAQLRKKLEGGK